MPADKPTELSRIHTYIHTYIHTCLLFLISMLWHRQTIFECIVDKLSSSAESRIRTWKSQGTLSPADWMPTHKPTELSRTKLKKTWTQQPVPMMSEHSPHLTSLPFGFRTWLWRYTCLLFLISMLWHRQAIFESKWHWNKYVLILFNFILYTYPKRYCCYRHKKLWKTQTIFFQKAVMSMITKIGKSTIMLRRTASSSIARHFFK